MFDAVIPPPVPREWQERFEVRDGLHETVTGPIAPVANDAELIRQFGYDPDEIEIVGTINQWRKQLPDGTWIASYFFRHRPKVANLDLPALYAAARRRVPKAFVKPTGAERCSVVALADVQAGKVGSRGGTTELVERLAQKRITLSAHLKRTKPTTLMLAEVGDLFEGFESGGNPMFTNDLSLAQQIDLAVTELYEYVLLMSRFGHVDVASVPSNHTAWRNGKQNLGRPGDDLGLMCHRQVERLAKAAGLDATWHYPAMYDESVTVNILDTVIGIVHGNQFGPGRAADWWGKQTHGGQPVGSADILLTGHYHHLRIEPTGRNPHKGQSKWWIQAPTLDNGSDWYRNKAGDDSDPGLLVFDVTRAGFDLQSLTVL